ncbi:MAG: DUF4209 domain-containing protein [Phormidesmis sp. CAN_BIN44]|nr:DUF4209 domain-containing protein [Phormidesmis sp. CAN_BIN44]
MLRSESDSEPFSPSSVMADGSRSVILKDFSDQQLTLLKELAPSIQDSELRARIADILWERRRDFQMAQLAITSYLESAQRLEDPEHWFLPFQRIQRAVRIAARLGRDKSFLTNVIEYVESLLAKFQAEDPLYFSAELMRLLQEQRFGNSAKYAKLSEQAATSAELSRQWDRSREYWDVTGRWYALAKDIENQRRVQVRIAETYVSEADAAVSNLSPSYMTAASCLQKAIEAYRRVGRMKERLEELHKLLLEYQPQLLSEMKMFSHEINISNIVEHTLSQMRGKSFKDAIIRLALMGFSPKVGSLRSQVQEALRNYPLQFLTSETLHNQTGKVVARKPSIISNDPEESEAALQISMLKHAVYQQMVHTSGIVNPARYQINLEHAVSVEDFAFIVMNNPFIPAGREMIYARGLLDGLRGDFLVSTHLLIPQIEHSIRYLLEQKGCIVSGLDDRGIQEEHNINVLIRRPELVEIFGEDIVFDLKGLLVHRFGTNLRNDMAHGLIGYNGFFTDGNAYLWWLTLRLCCLPIINLSQDSEP